MATHRREFLLGSGLALGALTAGTLTHAPAALASSEAHAGSEPATTTTLKSAGFGWEITNVNNNGADVYFQVQRSMTLRSLEVDVAFMILSLPAAPGMAEVLCTAAVSRGGPPTFAPGPQAYIVLQNSPDFGAVQVYNPNNLNIGYNGNLGQDELMALILKTWVPSDGTASATSRHIGPLYFPGFPLNAGDYLVFHMDHAGVPGDVEMQVVLGYF
jgi:hypothetical protein